MNIKTNFEEISFIQKIELYIIIIAIFIVLNYFYTNYIHTIKTPLKNTNVSKINQKLIDSKLIKKSKIILIKEIDEISEEFNINILKAQYYKNYFNLKLDGNFIDIINFYNHLSVHFNIKYFNINIENKKIVANIKFDIKYYFNPKYIYNKLNNIPNPFVYKTKNKSLKKDIKIIVNAIVGNNVLINHKWYTQDSTINNYKLNLIDKDFILLEDLKSKKILKVKVFNDKKYLQL
ncbi:MAG: hypothetical protein U9O56_07270 [Campylobacterota bacterium]|nr:hypothetical protein [Campylobacterota bacterium]